MSIGSAPTNFLSENKLIKLLSMCEQTFKISTYPPFFEQDYKTKCNYVNVHNLVFFSSELVSNNIFSYSCKTTCNLGLC